MKFKIPFTASSLDKLKKQCRFFSSFIRPKKNTNLQKNLDNCDIDITREQYLGICLRSFIMIFVAITILIGTLHIFMKLNIPIYTPIVGGFVMASFVSFSQLLYPHVYITRKQKEIEKNLLPALDDMIVQLNSGIPLFTILVNISDSEYGALSNEFKKIVRAINAGAQQLEVIEEMGEKNSSSFFRRTLWQMSNGMRAGSDLSIVVKDSIKSLNEEQLIQIQNYGNKLNPIIMFYMLISVIMPALAITFLTIIASLINLPEQTSTFIFIGLFMGVSFMQIMFLGVIRSLRPSLL